MDIINFPIREEDQERLRPLLESQELAKLIMEIAWHCFQDGIDQALERNYTD